MMKHRSALVLAMMIGVSGIGRHISDLLDGPAPRQPRKPDPDRQSAAEAKRQRRAERNLKLEKNKP